mmetsp:Transcript_98028/g.305286  ORF Transcript_98028/g.305286 Transcript_98028/m.305286 type:complete len:304 (-) Transcript_98028:82-993(-)
MSRGVTARDQEIQDQVSQKLVVALLPSLLCLLDEHAHETVTRRTACVRFQPLNCFHAVSAELTEMMSGIPLAAYPEPTADPPEGKDEPKNGDLLCTVKRFEERRVCILQSADFSGEAHLADRVQGESVHDVVDVDRLARRHAAQEPHELDAVAADGAPDVALEAPLREHVRGRLPLCAPRGPVDVEDAVPQEVRQAVMEPIALDVVVEPGLQDVLHVGGIRRVDDGRLHGQGDRDGGAVGPVVPQPELRDAVDLQRLGHLDEVPEEPVPGHRGAAAAPAAPPVDAAEQASDRDQQSRQGRSRP